MSKKKKSSNFDATDKAPYPLKPSFHRRFFGILFLKNKQGKRKIYQKNTFFFGGFCFGKIIFVYAEKYKIIDYDQKTKR